jgi:hypothetical protein
MVLEASGLFNDGRGLMTPMVAYDWFAAQIQRAGLVFGHNIRRFDLPLLNTGMLRHHLPRLRNIMTTDTLMDYPKRKEMSGSLENLAKHYDLDPDGQLHLSVHDWERINQLDPAGSELARRRVVSDVLLQERLRQRLLDEHLLREPQLWRG